MIIHIVRQDGVSYNACKEFAYKLCELYPIVIRIIDSVDADTILNTSTSDSEIYMGLSRDDIKMSSTNGVHLDIKENSTADEIIDACKDQLDLLLIPNDIYWVKNEKGWWYNVDRKHHGGILGMVTSINGKWYCIGEDYYMKTGWQPVEINEKFSCLYFDPADGHLDETKDTSDMPDPFSFAFPPIKVKWY